MDMTISRFEMIIPRFFQKIRFIFLKIAREFQHSILCNSRSQYEHVIVVGTTHCVVRSEQCLSTHFETTHEPQMLFSGLLQFD